MKALGILVLSLYCISNQTSKILTLLSFSITVHGLNSSNVHAIYGHGADKELTDLVPGIINQLGPDSLASLRKLAESYQAMNAAQQAATAAGGGAAGKEDDDEVPDVVENFDEAVAGKKEEPEVEKLD